MGAGLVLPGIGVVLGGSDGVAACTVRIVSWAENDSVPCLSFHPPRRSSCSSIFLHGVPSLSASGFSASRRLRFAFLVESQGGFPGVLDVPVRPHRFSWVLGVPCPPLQYYSDLLALFSGQRNGLVEEAFWNFSSYAMDWPVSGSLEVPLGEAQHVRQAAPAAAWFAPAQGSLWPFLLAVCSVPI